MPTFSRSLEQSLHRALALANERHHEYATLEHLLLGPVVELLSAGYSRGARDRALCIGGFEVALWVPEERSSGWRHTAAELAAETAASGAAARPRRIAARSVRWIVCN